MRRIAILAAAAIGSLVASNSFAALSVSTSRDVVSATLDRVILYGLSTPGTGDIFASDLTVTTPTANGLKFTVVPANEDLGTPASVVFLSANPASPSPATASTRSRANSVLFGTLAPGFPNPPTSDTAGGPAVYQNGVTSFQIVGFDGRDAATNNVGIPADGSLNGGKGAAIMSAVVPTGSIVNFVGNIADDSPVSNLFTFAVVDDPTGNVPEPTSLAALAGAAGLFMRRRK